MYCYPHRLWLKIRWAVKLFFIQTHPIWAAYCFSSATVPNITESNDFLIMMWQQNGPQHGWWRSCNWYSACPLRSQARFRAGQTKATYNEILPLPAAAFAWSQLCLRAWDITLLVRCTEFCRKSPQKLVILKLCQCKTASVDHKHKRYLFLFLWMQQIQISNPASRWKVSNWY